jgi:hypothetical protein
LRTWSRRLGLAFIALALLGVAVPPQALAQRSVELHIIGFGVDADTEKQLREIASAGGGRYQGSEDEAGLTRALGAATGVAVGDLDDIAEPATLSAEREPNDSYGRANRVAAVAAVVGAIEPKGDADWYHVTVHRQGELGVRISEVAAELDIAFRVWSGEKRVIRDWLGPKVKGGETTGSADLPRPGHYTIEVRDGSNDASAAKPYRLGLAFTPTADELEPNDSFGTAALIGPRQSLHAAILPKGDADWYRFRVDQQGALTVRIGDTPESLDVSFRVWNDEKRVLRDWIGPKAKGGDTSAVVDLPAPGVYRLEVRDGSNDARDVRPYRLALAFQPTGDQAEPNNSFASAATIAADGSVAAAILPKGDVDWYRVEVADQGALAVTVEDVPEALDVSFRVWDMEKRVISDWIGPKRKGGNTEGVVDLPRAGAFFLEVRDGSNNARAVEPYRLVLKFTPTRDGGEPNPTVSQATPLVADAPFRAAILPKGDVDWYRFEAPDQGALGVVVDQTPEALNISFRVWDDERRVIRDWIGPKAKGGETEAEVELPQAGEYLIEVRDGSNDARAVTPYSLTVGAL